MLVSFNLLLTIFRTDHIISELESDFHCPAVDDPLFRKVGVGAYIATVLAPELAVMLIKDDMKADDEEAR